MVATIDVTRRLLKHEGVVLDVHAIYKITKVVGEEAGYDFVEVVHKSKPEKYGHLYEFEFFLGHQYDYFAKDELKIEFRFANIKRVKREGKNVEQGDCRLVITTTLTVDYENEWGRSALGRFLFKIYQNYLAKEMIKNKYIIPSFLFTDKLSGAIKEEVERYE